MIKNTGDTPQYDSLPKAVKEFINIFIRTVNTARLYSKGHALHKKNLDQMYLKLSDALRERDFLFLGCAKTLYYFEGNFYNADDASLQKFLEFAFYLRISHFLIDKDITIEELDIFIEFLAEAKQGEGETVSLALSHDHISHAGIGAMDYRLFSVVNAVAGHLSQIIGDEPLLRQLIVQPVIAGRIGFRGERFKEVVKLCDNTEELKKLLIQIDTEMSESGTGVSAAQRGVLLGNFIQNLGDALASIDSGRRKIFAVQVGEIFNSLEPQIRAQILGSQPPNNEREEAAGGDVIDEIIRKMTDRSFIDLLIEGLEGSGAGSICFNNLFARAFGRYSEPGLLLRIIRNANYTAVREGRSANLFHLQQLEQLIIRHEETDRLNKEFSKDIEALATSIQMKDPMVEEEEMKKLIQTLSPKFLTEAKARLLIDLIRRHSPGSDEAITISLMENLKTILDKLYEYNNFYTMGSIIREVYLLLTRYPEEDPIRNTVNNILTNRKTAKLIQYNLGMCHTFEPEETKIIDAICHLYPEKSGDFLLDILSKYDKEGPLIDWIYRTLAGIGPRIGKALSRRLQDASNKAIPKLLDLIAMSGDSNLSASVEPLLEHELHEIRLAAVNAIGRLKSERSVPALEKMLFKKSWIKRKAMKESQEAAARALAEIDTTKAMEILQHAAEEGQGNLKKLYNELLLQNRRHENAG